MVPGSSRELMNHRDASNASGSHWKNPPTPITIPGASSERLQRPFRPHDNPYYRVPNNLSRTPGNPNVRQTLLAKPPDGRGSGTDFRVWKRQKLDTDVSSSVTSNGVLSSYAREPASRSNISEPDIQVIEPPRPTDKRSKPVPNDAEIIELVAGSDDLGERVPRRVKPSSPDPLDLLQTTAHAFETRPTEYSSSASNKGKGRAKESPELVEGSEEEEDISEFTPPPPLNHPPNAKVKDIPTGVVNDRKKLFESASASASVVTYHPIQKGVASFDLRTKTVVGRMKKKDEGALGHQSSTAATDHVGTSSSNLINPTRDKNPTLPLKAWCLGHHLFQQSELAHPKLSYKVSQKRIKVTWGGSPPGQIEFKLDGDVSATMVVNHSDEPLRENPVVQFITIQGSTWKGIEHIYEGFKGGAERSMGAITFLLSTAQDQGFTLTKYQTFVSKIRNTVHCSSVETMSPSRGASVWGFACRAAEMVEQQESRRKQDRVLDEPSALTRSVTSCSSTSVKTGPELKSSNGDSGPSVSHRRSARQSAIRSLRVSSPPPPPAQLEPDELVLMYPPTGIGALSIMNSDLRRLEPEEYLNDTLIEFGLKLWLNDLRGKDPSLANQIHVFSSFFYKKLNNRKNPEDGYKSVRKWTSKFDIFTKKYIIVPINENIHWYLAIIYEPGHTLEPPLPVLQISNTRTTRKRKQNQERAKAHPDTLTEVSLELSSPSAQVAEGEPEVDPSSMDATRVTTPSTTGNDEIGDVAITAFDKSCSITAGSEPVSTTSSDIQMRDSSPYLVHPPSDSMDVDADTSVIDLVPNPTSGVTEVQKPSMSRPSSGIPSSQFYGSVLKGGEAQPVVIEDNEDSDEDQQQEAEVDDMLAVTQNSVGDLPSQTYIFTLDSLGTRHPQAIKVLKNYLKSEAKDKHNFDEVREAVGKQVQVPVQPNTWDCGIYLLHFVKAFMSAPSEFVEQILSTRGIMPSSDRKKMWQDHEIPHFRDHLKSGIFQLSAEWKAEKTVREGANKQRNGDAVDVETLSSEGEVDIVEDVPSVKATSGPRQKQPATRLRG